jgi:hypothetical protein
MISWWVWVLWGVTYVVEGLMASLLVFRRLSDFERYIMFWVWPLGFVVMLAVTFVVRPCWGAAQVAWWMSTDEEGTS